MIIDISDDNKAEMYLVLKPQKRWKLIKELLFKGEVIYKSEIKKEGAKQIVQILNDWMVADVRNKKSSRKRASKEILSDIHTSEDL